MCSRSFSPWLPLKWMPNINNIRVGLSFLKFLLWLSITRKYFWWGLFKKNSNIENWPINKQIRYLWKGLFPVETKIRGCHLHSREQFYGSFYFKCKILKGGPWSEKIICSFTLRSSDINNSAFFEKYLTVFSR